MQRIIKILIVLSLFFPITGQAEVVDRVVAVVNDDIITLSELNGEGRSYFQAVIKNVPSQQLETEMQRARQEVLDHLIEQLLLAQHAKKFEVVISDEEVEQTVTSILERNKISHEQFQQELREKGSDEQSYRKKLKAQLLKSRLLNLEVRSKIVITDDKIKEYYDTYYATEQTTPGYHIMQIGLTWGDKQKTKTPEEALQKAEYIHKLLVEGKNFKELAEAFSDLPSAADGGDIGVFKRDEMAPYMKEAITSLKPGEFSDILQTPSGFQILKLVSSFANGEAQTVPLEEVKDEISKLLYQQAAEKSYEQFITDLKAQAFIKLNI